MTEQQHLSADQAADLADGTMAAADRLAANSHLATCPTCAQLRDDQAFVKALLAEESADPLPIPADVSTALEAALARAADERRAAPVPLEQVRHKRTGPRMRWLTGAAAAVVIAGVGVAGWQAADHGGGGNSNSAGGLPGPSAHAPNSVDGSVVAGNENTPPAIKGYGHVNMFLPNVSLNELPAFAGRLAGEPARRIPPTRVGCSRPIAGGLSSAIRWNHQPAVLSLNLDTRTATVLDCRNALQTLESVGY